MASNSTSWTELGKGSKIGFWPRAFNRMDHDRVFQVLLDEAPWTTGDVIIFGKPVLQPRMFCYMADDVTQSYSYSGSQFPVNKWHEAVIPLKRLAEELCETHFNSCLLNLYRTGDDKVGWHSDDEAMYGKNSTICSVSLGQARDFQIRDKADKNRKMSWTLGNGDVLAMAGTLQSHWQHQVPKRANVHQPRISLTFRQAIGGASQGASRKAPRIAHAGAAACETPA